MINAYVEIWKYLDNKYFHIYRYGIKNSLHSYVQYVLCNQDQLRFCLNES